MSWSCLSRDLQDDEPSENVRLLQAEGMACAKACSREDLDRREHSWSAWCRASEGSLAGTRLPWKEGDPFQACEDVFLVLERAMWAEDTDLVIICRKITEVK